MDGVHDVGGQHGFGAVAHTPHEPVFQGEWERLVFGILNVAIGIQAVKLDAARHSIERLPPEEYLGMPYYEKWMHAAEELLVANGLFTAEELAERVAAFTDRPDTPIPDVRVPELLAGVEAAMTTRFSQSRPRREDPLFAVGDRVRVKENHLPGHHRAPRYCQGRSGVVGKVNSAYVLPDLNVAEDVEEPHYTYLVTFDAAELWGDTAEPRESVLIDLWEPYLDRMVEGSTT